jgi:hypothetical protein
MVEWGIKMFSSMFWVQRYITWRGRPLQSGVGQKWSGSGRKLSSMLSKCSAQGTESNDVSHLGLGLREPPYHEKASATLSSGYEVETLLKLVILKLSLFQDHDKNLF